MKTSNQDRTLTAELNCQPQFIDLRLSGELDRNLAYQICKDTVGTAKSTDLNEVLLDIRPMIGRETYYELFQSVNQYPSDLRFLRIAVLEHQNEMERGTFHENVAVNRGFQIRYFTRENDALNWLVGA
ncbi:MAG: hypothetical protein AAFV80_09920 [Bacteroidota bacterium]